MNKKPINLTEILLIEDSVGNVQHQVQNSQFHEGQHVWIRVPDERDNDPKQHGKSTGDFCRGRRVAGVIERITPDHSLKENKKGEQVTAGFRFKYVIHTEEGERHEKPSHRIQARRA